MAWHFLWSNSSVMIWNFWRLWHWACYLYVRMCMVHILIIWKTWMIWQRSGQSLIQNKVHVPLQISMLVSRNQKVKRFSCVPAPLFPMIPIDHIIPHVLHLFLWVTDVLFNLLRMEIRRQMGLSDVCKLNLSTHPASVSLCLEWHAMFRLNSSSAKKQSS